MASLPSNHPLHTLIQRKMVRPPNLRPKTKFKQHTVGKDPHTSVQYLSLKPEYVQDPFRLQNYIRHLGEAIKTDKAIVEAEEGIYTWILKRDHMYATKLITNQEIGSLHVNLDVLTLHRNNVQYMNRNTLKNARKNDSLPIAAGELLLVHSVEESKEAKEGVRLYFNIQSGTYSEPKLTKCAKARGVSQGLHTKEMRQAMPDLKRECRNEMVQAVQQEMVRITGLPTEQVRFLSCSEEVQRELEAVPFLQGVYTHGACRDEDDYLESIAGRNLIRRFMAHTSIQQRNLFDTYFQSNPQEVSSILGKRGPSEPSEPVKEVRRKTGGQYKTRKNRMNKQRSF